MATTKIPVTLPDTQLEEIRQRVATNEAASISGYIQRAVQKSPENEAEFLAIVKQVLMETGGPITPKERAWARRMITPRKRTTNPAKRRKPA